MEDHSKYKPQNRNPRENANLLSVWTNFFTLPTFFLGYRKGITEDDVYETFSGLKSSTVGTVTIKLWKDELNNASKNKRMPSLRKVFTKLLLKEYLIMTVLTIVCEVIIKPLQAYFLGELILCYSEPQSKLNPYLYTLGIVVSVFMFSFLVQPALMGSYVIALKLRIMCGSLIYRKVLKLGNEALSQNTPGQILNMISNDIAVFEKITFTSQYLWIAPLQTVVFVGLMYKEIGISSFFGVAVLLLLMPIYYVLGKLTSKYRLSASTERDHRLRLMNEIIHGINVIKMYAWEKPFAQVIAKIRRTEIHFIKFGLYIKCWYLAYGTFYIVSVLVTIVSWALLNQSFNAKSAFIVTPLLYTNCTTLTYLLPQGLIFVSEMSVSLDRITAFLLCDEVNTNAPSGLQKMAIKIENGISKWNKCAAEDMISTLNFELTRGDLVAIIGSVGSGKTSLLNMILGEKPLTSGLLSIGGSISYASQEPWIFSSTVRQNILFGSVMDEKRYNTVIQCCALERDLKLLPYGDKTTVGEKGTSLSGGQKARINLARAVYRNADIYLLDDPLSAVDAYVGKQIFEKCIQTFLKGKTVVLVTHQLQYLKHVEYLIVLHEGSVIAKGTTKELDNTGFNFVKYLKQDQDHVIEPLDGCINTKHAQPIKNLKKSKYENETKDSSYISFDTYKYYFFAPRSYLFLIAPIVFFILTQIAISATNYFLAQWVNAEHLGKFINNNQLRHTYIYVFCSIAMASVIFTILRSVYSVNLSMKSSKVLHEEMFTNVIHAVVGFFHTNSSGIILNRFAKDLGTVDELLSATAILTLRTILSICGVLLVICFVNAWFVIPTVSVIMILYYSRRFYLTTALNIWRVEGQLRGPMFSHVNASLQGLTTIRAFCIGDILTSEFYHHQDMHSSSLYMALSTSRAFAFWTDLIVVVYIIVLTLYYTFYPDVKGGNVGLVISQALQMISQLAWSVRQITDLENFMVSVERISEYNSIKKERSEENAIVKNQLTTWPNSGEIEYVNVNLRYSEEMPYVLKNLSFKIRSLEKVGIVGRTGAGKSSILSALFQLVQIEGSIIIDAVNVQSISLNELRKKISIIPQDPVLFSGSIRYNLDPFNEYDDDILWKALEEVRLKKLVDCFSSGLHFEISHEGTTFSVGQRQLICLARAIVRNNKILLLDEATANVDLETDTIIQETIRTKFANCTVLTIAHRLNTVMDSDKVLVMDAGVAVEFDHPHLLLQNKTGMFYNLVQQTEKVMAETLAEVARKSYEKNIKQKGL